jgi:hypothetical protein
MAKRGRPPNSKDDVADDVRAVVALLTVNSQPYPKKDDRVKEAAKKADKSPRAIYSLLRHYEDNAQGWSRRFLDPIVLPDDGGKLCTLRDADEYLRNQHWTIRRCKEWKAASQAIKLVIALDGSTTPAQIAVLAVVNWLNDKK